MNPLPDRLNLDHLKKQAKELIRLYRSRDPAAMARFRNALPAAAGRNDEDISSPDFASTTRNHVLPESMASLPGPT